MDLPHVSDYTDSNNYLFPSHNIDPELKDKKWGLELSQALYSLYLNGYSGGIPYSQRDDFFTNRLYAEGMQSADKYKERLVPKNKKTGERKGWANLSWDILSIAPKFRAIFLSMMDEIEHDIVAIATDGDGQTEKDEKKWHEWAAIKLKPMMEQIGVQMQLGNTMPTTPEDVKELNLLWGLSFKLAKEIFMEKFLKDSFTISRWKDIKRELLKDFFALGQAWVKDYTDPVTKKVKYRYIDPINFIVPYSRKSTYDNIDMGGEIRPYNLSDLRPLLYKEGYTEDDVMKIAQSYSGANGNPSFDNNYQNFYNLRGYYQYDNFKIHVLDSEFKSNDVYYSERITTKKGREKIVEREYGYEDNKSTVEKTVLDVVYGVKWVIGTDCVFDFGLTKDTPRKSSNEGKTNDIARLSFHGYKVAERSFISLIIPHLDNIQLAWLKLQNAMAMSRVKGLLVELGTIENLTIGGTKMTPLEIFKIGTDSGLNLYRATTHHSEVYSPNAGRPIQEIEGGMGNQLNEWITTIDFNMKMIQNIIGMNDITDGSNRQGEIGKGVAMIKAASSNNALQPVYEGYKFIKEESADNASLRMKMIARYGDMEAYRGILGDGGVEVWKQMSKSEFNIKLEAKPSDEKKDFYRQLALKAQETPLLEGGISYGDFFEIEKMIDDGQLKMASILLSYKQEQNRKEANNRQQQNIQAQSQASQQQNAQKGEIEKAKEEAKAQAQIAIDNNAFGLEKQKMELAHKYKLEEISLSHGITADAKKYSVDKNKEIADGKREQDIFEHIHPKEVAPKV